MTSFEVAVDIGGTFTDTVMIDENGQLGRVKTSSTPPAFHEGFLNGVNGLERPLAQMTRLAHGTTVGINAIVTRHGAKMGLVTTEGFRDVLGLGRSNRAEMFDLWWHPADPLIPRRHCFEVPERIGYDGEVVTPLDEDAARALAGRIKRLELEAVAVVFINSPINGEHEQRMREILAEELDPDVHLCISSEILPEVGEPERTATTAINAYIAPLMSAYVSRLETQLKEQGYEGRIAIGTSAGGVATPELVRQVPARTVESGPAAGVMAAREISAAAGFGNVVTFDMGGTSLDLGLIVDGEVRRTTQYLVEWGLPVRFPCVDVFSIGAGGGSIAWIDAGGTLLSGPQSAGARPGPACYGEGGSEPTNTDAQVVLGRMAPESFLGGEMTIHPDLSREAIQTKVAEPLGYESVEEAASAILAISDNNMLQSLRLATVERGYDPRDFALFALGGAGPVFASEVARAGDIKTVISPLYPGLTSALGLLMVDVRHDASHPLLAPQDQMTLEQLNEVFSRLEERVTAMLRADGIEESKVRLEREMDLRYFGQANGLTVSIPGGVLDEAAREKMVAEFLDLQLREFGYTMPDAFASIELVTARVAGIGAINKAELPRIETGSGAVAALKDKRPVYWDGSWQETAIYDRDQLGAGDTIAGPAVVEQVDSTTLVPPGDRARVDEWANIIIEISN